LAITGALEVIFNSLEHIEGKIIIARVVGSYKALFNGIVGSWALWESVYKRLS
jgi:hypothetical protein